MIIMLTTKIFKKVNYNPYKVRLVHELTEDYFAQRLEFCETEINKSDYDANFSCGILFSDEETFFKRVRSQAKCSLLG